MYFVSYFTFMKKNDHRLKSILDFSHQLIVWISGQKYVNLVRRYQRSWKKTHIDEPLEGT